MIELVASSPEFAESWLRWRSEPNAVRFNPMQVTDLEALRKRMIDFSSDLSKLIENGTHIFFIRAAKEPVGVVTVRNVSLSMKYAEIGYSLSQAHQNQGIGTKAVAALVEKVFAETDLRRLTAYIAEDNIASRRVVEKVGFKLEGLFREHFLINEIPTNEAVYGILRSDLVLPPAAPRAEIDE